jgi:hypothetical protein
MSTTTRQQVHVEQVLVEVTSLLMDRARIQLERDAGNADDQSASVDLRRLHEMEGKLKAIRRQLGLAEAASPPTSIQERQVSRFYEVPGQEDT